MASGFWKFSERKLFGVGIKDKGAGKGKRTLLAEKEYREMALPS